MPFLFFDPTMILLIPGLILAIYAQFKVKSTFKKYSKITSSNGITGRELAFKMMQDNNLYNVDINPVAGDLTDHYDPTTKKLGLSETVYNSKSIAAISVAAHEVGHAIQHKESYAPLSLRNSVFPIANIGSTMAFPLFFIGFLFKSGIMLQIGVALFSFAVIFHIVTLPVEFNASRRGLKYLKNSGIVNSDEYPKAKAVLTAAALTYVASTLMAVLQLARMLILSNDE